MIGVHGGRMRKFNLYLTEQQKAALDRLHVKTGTPIAEILRRMIDAGLGKAEKSEKKGKVEKQ
jgi:Ribbon-helix-helix domain